MAAAFPAFTRIIAAIGEPDFVDRAAAAVRDLAGFDLVAVFAHRGGTPIALHDNFDLVGCRAGIERYVRHTHRINPILGARSGFGVHRARDFRTPPGLNGTIARHLVRAEEEELGFRTLGWPERQEEVVLCFEAWGGLVELGLYRARGSRALAHATLDDLTALTAPLAAAFDRHRALQPKPETDEWRDSLSPREREIVELMLAGCSSEAIALRLGIAQFTVKDHRKRIFRKLGIGALAELFALDRHIPPRRDGARAALL
jgi:DNA-binding CsgD family transcriptional regulator